MRLPLPVLLLCSLMSLASLAETQPSDEVQAPPDESAASAPPPAAASAPAPAAPADVPSAATTTGAEAKVASAEKAAEDPVVCKSKAITGTRFAKKSCMRESEWAAMTKKAEEDFATIRNRQVTCPDCRD